MRQPPFARRALGASALSLLFLPATAFADDPPAEPAEDVSTIVQKVAEQAVEVAKEAAVEAAEEAQRAGAEAAEAAAEQAHHAAEQAHQVAEHAQKAAEHVAKDAEKAANEVIKKVERHGVKLNFTQGYHLDLHATAVPAVLNAHVKLDGLGVLVDSVGKDGPADRAGIQRYDVIVAVGDRPTPSVKDLFEAVQASEGKEIAINLVRAAEPLTVKVTPVKPTGGDLHFDFQPQMREELDVAVSKLEENIREKLKNAGLDVRMQLIRPGHMLPSGATFTTHARIPDDLSIAIEKKGESQAEIKVRRGEETWSVKEGDLGSLPDEIRPHVERMLGHGRMPFKIALPGTPAMPFPPGVSMPHGPFVVDREVIEEHRERLDRARKEKGPRKEIAARKESGEKRKEIGRGGVERRLEIMSREMQRMNEQMQALQRELSKRSSEEDEEEIEIEIRDDEIDGDEIKEDIKEEVEEEINES